MIQIFIFPDGPIERPGEQAEMGQKERKYTNHPLWTVVQYFKYMLYFN